MESEPGALTEGHCRRDGWITMELLTATGGVDSYPEGKPPVAMMSSCFGTNTARTVKRPSHTKKKKGEL
jgi:hypothetical protein